MKYSKFIILAVVIIFAGFAVFYFKMLNQSGPPKNTQPASESIINNISNNMKLTSTAFENSGNIPKQFTCDGQGINPELLMSSVPENAKALAIIIDDPDAPLPGGFVHWVMFNLDPKTNVIKENSRPESGSEGTNGAGTVGYVAPCPPSGVHHYQFKLYALDKMLDLTTDAKREDVEKAMEGHILEETRLIGLYERQ